MSDHYRYCKVIKKDRNRTPKNEKSYKTYLKPLKRQKLQKFKSDTRKTWSVMKEILGKYITKSSTLPTKITVNKADICDAKKKKKRKADEFNKFFTNIGTDLTNKVKAI